MMDAATQIAKRSFSYPMRGSIYRRLDDRSLVRGITYTYLPDGRTMRVPAMQRLSVRSHSESHANDEAADAIQALQDLLTGRKPIPGRARLNRRGVAHGGRINPDNRDIRGPPARDAPPRRAAIEYR